MSRDQRSQASGWRQLRRWRTPLIGILALVILLWSAVWTWDVDPSELLGYLAAILIGLATVVALAFVASLLLRWLRKRH